MAKIGCLKPFRGSWNGMKDVVLENGEIAFETTNKRIYMGNGSDSISNLNPYINNGTTDISNIGDGSITGAINTINSKAEYLSGGGSPTPVFCRQALRYGGQGAMVFIAGYLGDSSISRGLYVLSTTLSNPPKLNTDEVFFIGNTNYKPVFSIDNGGYISISVFLQYWTAVVIYSIVHNQ